MPAPSLLTVAGMDVHQAGATYDTTVYGKPIGGPFTTYWKFDTTDSVGRFRQVTWNGSAWVWAGATFIDLDGMGDKSFLSPPGLHAANLTALAVPATNATYAVYLGRARAADPTIDVVFRVTTAAVTITWAEVAIATGTPVANGSPSLTTRGHVDTSAVVNSTGIKKVTISPTGIWPGADLWFLIGTQATTPGVFRGCLADDLQSGVFVTATSTRPSTMSAPKTFTVGGATTVPVWVTARQY